MNGLDWTFFFFSVAAIKFCEEGFNADQFDAATGVGK